MYIFGAVGTRLQSRCLGTAASSGSTISAFRHQVHTALSLSRDKNFRICVYTNSAVCSLKPIDAKMTCLCVQPNMKNQA